MQIEELSSQFWNKALASDYSTNGYPTRTPTITPPNTTNNPGLIPIGADLPGPGGAAGIAGGSMGPRCVLIVPYAGGSSTDDQTFSMQVLGWRPTNLGGAAPLFIPISIGTYACQVSTVTGVAGSDIDNTKNFCDLITMTLGPILSTTAAAASATTPAAIVPDWFVLSGAADSELAPLMISQRTFGFRWLELIFTTGGSAAQCNALWCKM